MLRFHSNYPWNVQTRDRITSLIGVSLLIIGALAILLGAYPLLEAAEMFNRVWHVLLFVVAMTVVADIASRAGLFDVVARIVVQLAGKGPWLLWALLALITVVFTVFLSLDTTVVLVTPLAVILARRVGLSPVPYALTVVWLANTGSMLLPISNLTNLLAARHVGGGTPLGFAQATWVTALVCIVVPLVVIAVAFRRSFRLPSDSAVSLTTGQVLITRGNALSYGLQALRGRPELVFSSIVVTALVVALVAGVDVWIPSTIAAVLLVVFTAFTKPHTLSWSMVPVPMILLTSGLFVALGALGSAFINDMLATIAPQDDSLASLLMISGLGAGTANAINNLPAYLALEPLASSEISSVALLVGVNAGPLITPWASLATLLWYERLVALKADFGWVKYVALGVVVAPLTVACATVALWLHLA